MKTNMILEKNDYEERTMLMQSLSEEFRRNSSDATLPPWERVTAAVGCATYDPGADSGVDSVLERADAAMYGNKKKMKGIE